MAGHTPTGHVRIEERAKGRVWIAEYEPPDGPRTRKTLGPAWVRPTGRTTSRGAPLWRTGHGSKPDDTYLTPAEAEQALERLLAGTSTPSRGARRARGKTFGEACDSWLRQVEHLHGVEDTTLRTYKVIAGKLQRELGPQTQVRRIAAGRIERYQFAMLETPVARGKGAKPPRPLARKTVRTRMIVLRGILDHAHTQGWTAANVMDDVTIIPEPAADPDFNVLEPHQVETVAAAMLRISDGELPLMRNGQVDEHALAVMRERRFMWSQATQLAAYTGLRFGELRDLRWRDIDWTGRNLQVRRNTPGSASAATKATSKTPKGKRGRSVPLIDQAVAVLERLKAAGYPHGPNDLVLATRTGCKLEPGRVRDAFYAGLRTAGLGYLREKPSPIVFHDLRHTFGSIAVRKLPLSDVQEILGHADVKTTMRYVHFIPRNDIASLLSQAFTDRAAA